MKAEVNIEHRTSNTDHPAPEPMTDARKLARGKELLVQVFSDLHDAKFLAGTDPMTRGIALIMQKKCSRAAAGAQQLLNLLSGQELAESDQVGHRGAEAQREGGEA